MVLHEQRTDRGHDSLRQSQRKREKYNWSSACTEKHLGNASYLREALSNEWGTAHLCRCECHWHCWDLLSHWFEEPLGDRHAGLRQCHNTLTKSHETKGRDVATCLEKYKHYRCGQGEKPTFLHNTYVKFMDFNICLQCRSTVQVQVIQPLLNTFHDWHLRLSSETQGNRFGLLALPWDSK